MVATTIQISAGQAGGTTVHLPQYAGVGLLLLRGGHPFAASKYTVLSTGGFQLTTSGDILVLNEEFAVFPQALSANGMVNRGFGVSQYPHTVVISATSSIKNASGNWVSTPGTAVEKSCRFEPNSGTGKVATADGKMIDYSGIIYMPLPVNALAPGTPVDVLSGATVLLHSTVKRFNAGQLNARIWL